jgi:hypothetical protein
VLVSLPFVASCVGRVPVLLPWVPLYSLDKIESVSRMTEVREHKVGGPDVFTFREIGELAADVPGKRETLQIRKVPLLSLRAAAMIAGAAGLVFRKCRWFAAVLRWMIYAGTHDAVARSCGRRRLSDEFMAKADALKVRTPAAIDLQVASRTEGGRPE